MSFIDLKALIFFQIGIDIAIVFLFVFLIRRFKDSGKGESLDKAIKTFESLITDADKIAGQFKEQLERKHRVIKSLNEQLDKRIISLNLLLNRTDVLLSTHGKKAGESDDEQVSFKMQEEKIIALAGKGHKVEEIATMLSIPKEGVRLILDLKKKSSRIGIDEGVS
ncbi:MAG TPA: hypothetical protein VMW42_04870 [Desulfatiglandales bacterium]|nr:hypothetical protein [Desulfatiglandales bacterium]